MAKDVLVTGSHRSGTTWVGQMLATAPRTGYIHEPFNIDFQPDGVNKPFERWFQYIDESSPEYCEYFKNVISFKYPRLRALYKSPTPHDFARAVRDYARSTAHRALRHRAIVKDPIAILSAEWLSAEFDMDVVIMIRHPAAFCSSLKLKNWQFDFNEFLAQPAAIEKHFPRYADDIREHAAKDHDIISQGVLLWNCIHSAILQYRNTSDGWIFVRHEDLSADPIPLFRSMFDDLGLDFSSTTLSAIVESSGSHNPSEQTAGREYRRDSKKNIKNWQKRLSEAEVLQIREGVGDLFYEFYSDADW